MAGRPEHKPTEKDHKTVETMVAVGIPVADICKVIGITEKTLRKHYKEELNTAVAKANSQVGKRLFQKCMEGDTPSLIWWTKTRMRWKETKVVEGSSEAPPVFKVVFDASTEGS